MKKYNQLLLQAMLAALLFFSCAQKKTSYVGTAEVYPISQLTDSVKNLFTKMVNDSFLPADKGMLAMAVYLQRGDEVLVDTNYFFSNNKQPLPNDSTVFQMGSVTKTFTAALIARLAKFGKIDLDAPAQHYLPTGGTVPVPSIPNNYNGRLVTSTPGNLASMNAGLVDDIQPQQTTHSTPYLYAFDWLNKNPYLLYKPDSSCYVYSNLGFGILGLIACLQAYPNSATYYNNYEKLVTDSLLAPLAMHDTRITPNASQMKRMALPYGADKSQSTYKNPGWPFNYSAGGLYSTLSDMRLYANEMIGLGQYITRQDTVILLKPRSYKYADTCQPENNHPATKQAMAWIINADMKGPGNTGFKRYSKDGGLAGFSTFITFSTPIINDVQYRAYVVLWANRQNFPVQPSAPQAMQFAYDFVK